MLNTIGSKWFTVNFQGKVDGEQKQLNQYLIKSTVGVSEEYLYVDEDQIDELINLLQKTRDLIK